MGLAGGRGLRIGFRLLRFEAYETRLVLWDGP